jgi:hypothetical protein
LALALLPDSTARAQVVAGNSSAASLSCHIYTLRIPEPIGDTLPAGPSIFYVFSIYDTGSTLVGIEPDFDALILEFDDPQVPALLDVRLWGLDAVDPGTLGAPLDFPEREVQDIGIELMPSGIPTLLGGPVTNSTVAHIDYANIVTRVFSFGVIDCPSTQFFSSSGGLTPAMWADLTAFGSTTPVGGKSRGQRYYVDDIRLENGSNSADSGSFDFLIDTGNTTTQISEPLAAALGINLGAVDDTICIGGASPDCTGGEVLNGYLIDRVAIRSSDATEEYVIDDPLVFVKPPPAFGGAADANIGTNFFETTSIIVDGPGQQLGIDKSIPVPEPGQLALLSSGVGLLLMLARRRARSPSEGAR